MQLLSDEFIMQVNQNHKAERLTQQQKKLKKLNKQLFNYRPLRYLQYDSVIVTNHNATRVFTETDKKFVQSVENICKARTNVLDQLIGKNKSNLSEQQCQQIHHLALLHRKANKINHNSNLSKNDLKKHQELRSIYCQCGCERFQGQTYPICYDIQNLNFLGSGILLFFNLVKGLFISMGIFVLIYAFYALSKNSQGDYYMRKNPSQTCISSYCQFKDQVSSYNLPEANYVTNLLNWIGLASMCVWILISRFLNYYCFYKDQLIDENLKSSSDYAVKIDNLPYGEYSQQDLFQFLQQIYQRKIANSNQNKQILQVLVDQNLSNQILPELNISQEKNQSSNQDISKRVLRGIKEEFQDVVRYRNRQNHFNIRSIQIIYRMDFCRKIIQKIVQRCMNLKKMLKQQQGKYYVARKDRYLELKKETIQIYQTLEDMRKKFLNDSSFRKKIATRAAIIQFYQQSNKILLLEQFGHQNVTFLKRIKQRFIQWWSGSSTLIFKGQIPIIKRAPEPSDILWQNCQKQFSYMRLFGIFIATSLVIFTSLGAIAGLRALQFYFKDKVSQNGNEDTAAKLFNFLTSIVLIVINAVLWVLLNFLLEYQYNHTYTDKIISQMNKSSPATWINTIIIPIIVNYIIYGKYYGADGVSGLAFDYQVTALAISLPLMVINPIEVLVAICLKIKCIRNYLIRSRYRKRSDQSDEQIQKEMMDKIYKLYSSPQFIIQQAYIYILNNIMHALFFCQLQPFILILVGIQIFMFYWACKIRVLRLCKIPALIDKLVFQVAMYEMMLAPIFYGVGCIYNSYVSHKIDPSRSLKFVAPSICIGLGILNYFNPGDFITKIIEKITNCFTCLKKQNVFKDQRQKKRLQHQKLKKTKMNQRQIKNQNGAKTEQKKQKDQMTTKQVLAQEDIHSKNVRLQNYYKDCNSLTLLGFERAIFGESSTQEIEFEYKNFCQSHVEQNIQTFYYIDQVIQEEKQQIFVEDYLQIQVKKRSQAVIIQ